VREAKAAVRFGLLIGVLFLTAADAPALTITPDGYAFDREPAFGVLSLAEGIFEDGA
jgi:hypothetical protein